MLKLNPRKILAFEIEDLWKLLTGQFILVMDDGEVITNYKEVLFSAYCWKIHRLYPNLPMLKRHLVSSVMNNNTINNNTHVALLSNIHKDLIEYYNIEDPMKIWELAQLYYQITNDLYNGLIIHISEYTTGMDILDFIEVFRHPDIQQANTEVKPEYSSIKNCYDKIIYTIMNSPDLRYNNLTHSVKSGLVRMNNLKQCIGPRGFLDDIDGTIFENPIMTGYLEGISNLLDSFMESRSASKALFFSKGQLEDTEYFARRLQLQTMVVSRVHIGDCGSTNYLHWTIRDKDLPLMTGVYYLDDETNSLKYIRKEDKHLVGKILKLRSPVAGCLQ